MMSLAAWRTDVSLDLDRYFMRIGYAGPRVPTLEVLHALTAAHTTSIPFENVDVLLDRPIDLALDAVFDKLVLRRRGGYCFEQNGLFLHVLGTLGFDVTPMSARVRLQRPRDETPPRTHLCIRVVIDGVRWLTDVGVGGLSLTSAILLAPGVEQPTPHERRRLVRDGELYFHQALLGDTWTDVYETTLEHMPVIDREVANWYTSAHLRSKFKQRLTVARAAPDGGRVSILNRELTHRDRSGRAVTQPIESRADLLAILDREFGMPLPADTPIDVPGMPWT